MKKILIMMLIALLPFVLFANGAKEAEQVQDDPNETLELVLMTKDSTASGFKDWISLVEKACNLKKVLICKRVVENLDSARKPRF